MSDIQTDQEPTNARLRFLQKLLSQVGSRFEMGSKADPEDLNPDAFDASELVEWASHQAGVPAPDGSWIQYQQVHEAGATLDVAQALGTEGALLFWFSEDPLGRTDRPDVAHVAVSLGDGRVVEATNGDHELVRIAPAGNRFTHAGELPDLVGVELTGDEALAINDLADRLEVDQDRDGVYDTAEKDLGLDPGLTDSDRDGVSDGAEVQLGWYDEVKNRRDLDSDGDGLLDVAEERLGTDPNSFDTDGDGLDDHLEIMTGLNPNSFNSSLYARSEEGLAQGAHEDHAAAFGTMSLREHINYLRLEADPDDPRVSDEFREDFALFGREPDRVEDPDAFADWERNHREIQSGLEGYEGEFDEDGFEIEPGPEAVDPIPTDVTAEFTTDITTEFSADLSSDPLPAPAPEPVDDGFDALEDDLDTIETELLAPFDDAGL